MKKLQALLVVAVMATTMAVVPAFADTADACGPYSVSDSTSNLWISVESAAVAISLWLTDGGWLVALAF